MKRIFKLATLATLIVFAAACGKNESGGSGGNKYGNMLSNNPDLTQASLQAVADFGNWYQSKTEGSSPSAIGVYGLDYQSSNASMDSNCEEREAFGFLKYWWCSGSSSSTSNSGSFDCRVTVTTSNASLKPSNAILKKIYEGKMGKLVEASRVGSLYLFQFQKTNGFVVSYKIDTNYHSAFQPVEQTDSETGVVQRLTYYTMNYQVVSALPVCQ